MTASMPRRALLRAVLSSAALPLLAALLCGLHGAGAQELGIPQASGAAATAQAQPAANTESIYLMAGVAPGAPDRLSILRSSDGVDFVTQASEAYAPPAGVLRSPAIVRRGDGFYYVAYAAGVAGESAGLARSRDLRRWSFLRTVPLGAGATAHALHWMATPDGGLQLSVALADGGVRLLAPDATLTTWAAPQSVAGFDGYDDVVIAAAGNRYLALARRRGEGGVELLNAPAPRGPWTVTRSLAWAGAPSAIDLVKLADGGWRIVGADADRGPWSADSRDGGATWTARQPLTGVAASLAAPRMLAEPHSAFARATVPAGVPQAVTWDPYSLKIGGKRVVVWSGEIHPFRLPDPDGWRDVIQKMKALGFNGVSFYFDWAYHSAAPGRYDFSGVRNVERVLEIAREEGMYVIARVGPYINAELSGGGFPGWMMRNRFEARTDDPAYLAAADAWLTQIDAIVARHQVTDGGGSVIAYQLENELGRVEPKHVRAMAHLAAKARADGITVPLFHNAAGRLPDWAPADTHAPWANPGPTDLYAFDGYPGGTCDVHGDPSGPNRAPDWGMYAVPGPKAGALTSPATPGFGAEIGSGWFDYWGSNGTYGCSAERQGAGYQRVFYGTNLANRITIHNLYMAFGGTSWGWLPGPIVYTSYDYGAPIDEARGLRPKALALKQQGMFVAAAMPLLAHMDKGAPIATTSQRVRLYHNVNTELGAHLLFAVHGPSDLTSDDAFAFDLATRDGRFTVKSRLHGQDAKLLVADYDLERQHLVYSTSELQAHLRDAQSDLVLLQGRTGEHADTVLRYASPPRVEVLAGRVDARYDAARGDLTLAYTHDGLARVRITGGGRAPLLLLLADEAASQRFWLSGPDDNRVLVSAPALIRAARVEDGVLRLRGDLENDAVFEIWGGRFATATFNGEPLAFVRQPDGAARTAVVKGPDTTTLPDLGALAWYRRVDSLEAQPGFDDSAWIEADGRPSAAQTWTLPERGQPTLAMSDYGFHHGDVWYRGRIDLADPATNQLALFFGAGGAGLLQAWVDGRFLGGHELDTGRSFPETTGSVRFDLGALAKGPHTVAVMVRNNAHNWDLMADDAHREARGLIAASLSAKGGRRFAVPIRWRIQGNRGGELGTDPLRGPLNNGGLYGERAGWNLPGAAIEADAGWQAARPDASPPAPGTYWLRTQFALDLPRGHDVQLALQFGADGAPRPAREYRVLIFVNGWNLGQYIAHIGPQRRFVLPPGLLAAHGANTIALAVTSDGGVDNAPEPVQLQVLRAVRGGATP